MDLLEHGRAERSHVGRVRRRGPLDGREDDACSLVAVGGVRLGLGVRVLGVVVLDEVGTLAGQLGGRQATEGDVRTFGRGTGGVDPFLLEDAVRSHEGDLGHGVAQVDPQLASVVLGDATVVDEVRVGGLDLLGEGLVVGRLAVDPVAAEHGQTGTGGFVIEDVGDALAVQLGVIEDVHVLGAQLGGPLGTGQALEVVRGDDAVIVPRAAVRIVDIRFVRLTLAGLRQAGVGVGRTHHRDALLAQDGDRQLGSTRVERPDVRHDLVIGDGIVRVLDLGGLVPLAGRGSGIVDVLVDDLVTADDAALLFDGHVDRVHDRVGLGLARTLAGKRGPNLDVALAGSPATGATRRKGEHGDGGKCPDSALVHAHSSWMMDRPGPPGRPSIVDTGPGSVRRCGHLRPPSYARPGRRCPPRAPTGQAVVRDGDVAGPSSSGAQVTAETMPYHMHRRPECNTGRSRPFRRSVTHGGKRDSGPPVPAQGRDGPGRGANGRRPARCEPSAWNIWSEPPVSPISTVLSR